MNAPDPAPTHGRRRILAGLAALAAAGGGALFGWLRRPETPSETVAGRTATASSLQSSVVEEDTSSSTTAADPPGAETSTAEPTSTTEADDPAGEEAAATETADDLDTEGEDKQTRDTTGAEEADIAIPVICRQAWGAAAPTTSMPSHAVQRLTVHHTASPISRLAEAPGKIRTHQRFHQQNRGWADIAYHFLIDPAGNVYQGRDPSVRGDTATNYDPTGHLLVCLEGDFGQAPVNEAQIASLANVLAWGASHYGVAVSTLAGHRDYADTQCPGDAVYRLLTDGSLAQRIETVLAGGTLTLVDVCGADGDHLVAEIEASPDRV